MFTGFHFKNDIETSNCGSFVDKKVYLRLHENVPDLKKKFKREF